MKKTLRQAQLEDPGLIAEVEAKGLMDAEVARSISVSPRQAINEAVGNARTSRFSSGDAFQAEAIIRRFGFPALLIQDGTYEEPKRQKWRDALGVVRGRIEDAIAAVGRFEFEGHPQFTWNGTGWRIDDDVIITNRHVAELFCELKNGRPVIERGIRARVDFREEFGMTSSAETEFSIDDVIHIELDDQNIDLALFRLSASAAARLAAEPIPLREDYKEDDLVAAIGYPARSIYNDPHDQDRIFGTLNSGRYDVKRLSPGSIIGNEHGARAFQHDCTTLGGMSGSPLVALSTGCAVGLHYSGAQGIANNAVKAEYILDRCRKHSVSVRLYDDVDDHDADFSEDWDREPEFNEDRRRRRQSFDDRDGYRSDFLGSGRLEVALPRLNGIQRNKVAQTTDGETILKYRHFSAVMNRERRLAFFVAANIDGNSLFAPRRVNRFVLDPRLDKEFQADNRLYKHNPLDRGHLIRRLDPCWGTRVEAEQANIDSMFYTNIAPQHKDLNQKTWLDLENHILEVTDQEDARVSVFVGCIFDDNDPPHERTGIKVPMGFWKVIASLSKRSRGGHLHRVLQSQAFVLMQDHLVRPRDLEFVFGRDFAPFQVPVAELELMTGLDFHVLKGADTFGLDPEFSERIIKEAQNEGRPFAPPTQVAMPLRSVDDVVMHRSRGR